MTSLESAAKKAFESMVDDCGELLIKHGWENQPQSCRDSWMMAVKTAIEAEREACAILVNTVLSDAWLSDTPDDWIKCLQAAIRARSQETF